MARFRLTQAIATGALRFHAGEVVTDTIPLTLDAAATAMKSQSAWANEVISATIQGGHSIG